MCALLWEQIELWLCEFEIINKIIFIWEIQKKKKIEKIESSIELLELGNECFSVSLSLPVFHSTDISEIVTRFRLGSEVFLPQKTNALP